MRTGSIAETLFHTPKWQRERRTKPEEESAASVLLQRLMPYNLRDGNVFGEPKSARVMNAQVGRFFNSVQGYLSFFNPCANVTLSVRETLKLKTLVVKFLSLASTSEEAI